MMAIAQESPRFEVNWIGVQLGLGIAIKRNKYSTFRYETLLIVGPFVFVLGLWRDRRW